MDSLLLFQLSLALLGLYILQRLFLSKSRTNTSTLPLPPGPKGLPLVGNLNDLPPPGITESTHWLAHKDRYGPLSSITVLGQTIIVIHDKAVAFELMDKRAGVHSGRPSMEFAMNMCGWIEALASKQLTPTFRLYRKYAHQQLGTSQRVGRFAGLQEVAVGRFLWRLKRDEGGNLDAHVKTEAAEIMLKMLYNYNIEPHKPDPLAAEVEAAMVQFSEATVPGKWTVDMVPALKYLPEGLPGTGFRKTAKHWKKTLFSTADVPFNLVKKQLSYGKAGVSFVSKSIEEAKAENKFTAEDEHAIKWSAASMYLGGADTTVGTIDAFFLAMSMFPGVQRKAQEEIDRVVGSSRLPTDSDKENLPYIRAMVEEAQRWHLIAPMGLPHMSSEDDEINGYRIPKGALLLPAAWWYTRDPEVYHDPEEFKPERYMAPYNEPNATNFTFGFGRRICPGRYLADSSLYLTFAQSLAVFDIRKAVDQQGKEIEPEHSFLPGVIAHPGHFSVRVTPRSAEHARLVEKVVEQHPWEEGDAKALEGMEA